MEREGLLKDFNQKCASDGGFDAPIQFLQTGLNRPWYARRV